VVEGQSADDDGPSYVSSPEDPGLSPDTSSLPSIRD